jgi:acyl-CoA dehydrogenase
MTPKLKEIPSSSLVEGAAFQEALSLAAEHADDVDRKGRFPAEAVEALGSAGALGWLVPQEFGGAGAPIEDVAAGVLELSRRCAATGMVFAMHQIQVACIVRHALRSAWFANYLGRLTREQRLIASATSEVGTGGDLRRSIAALHPEAGSEGALLRFEKSLVRGICG